MFCRNLLSFAVACALYGACVAAPIAPPAPEAETESPERERPPEVLAAIEQFEQGDTNAAFETLKSAAVAHSNLPPPRVMLANLYFSSGDVAAGRQALEQAAVESPDDPETYLILGDLLLRERRWTEADAVYAKTESLIAKYTANEARKRALESRLASGQSSVAEARAQWDAAAKLLTRWTELAPQSSAARQRLGVALFMLKREKDAFAAFESAAALAKNVPPPPISMAMLFQQQGNAAKAAEWIQFALNKSPRDFATQLGAAQWNWQVGDLDRAASHATSALEINPDSLEAQLLVAQGAFYRHDLPDAEARLERLQAQAPGNFVVANLLAWVLSASDDAAKRQRAVELAGLNTERYPDSAEAAATAGYALYRAGHAKQATAQLARIKANTSLSRDAAYRVARVLHDAQQRDRALELLQAALANDGLFAAEAEAKAWHKSLTESAAPGS